MNDEDYFIPRCLDAPKLLLLWEMDTALIFILTFIIFGLLNLFFTGFFAAYFISKGWVWFKEEGGNGLIWRVLYWYFPSFLIGVKLDSAVRIYFGE